MSQPSPEPSRDRSDDEKTSSNREQDVQWGHLAGIGLQMAVGVVLGLAVGTWLDRKYGWHYASLIGAMLGLAGGMYLLIKDAIRINKD